MVPLLDKSLLINSGKGGVGKSTLSAALAVLAARKGKRVLLVESDTKADSFGRLHEIFQVPPMGHTPREIFPNLWGASLNADQALEDYITGIVRVRTVVRAIFNADFVKMAYAAAPGVKELLIILAIHGFSEEKDRRGHKRFDLIVYDAPPTGHGLFFLQMPQTLIDIVKVGPLIQVARGVNSFLMDSRRTQLNLVTIAQEMPVVETMEFIQSIRDTMEISIGCTFLNALHDRAVPAEQEAAAAQVRELALRTAKSDAPEHRILRALTECERLWNQRHAVEASHVEKLRPQGVPVVRVPFIYAERFDKTTIHEVARCLETQIA
ncbi:MAG: ArsA family ATPase [Deltaproteobacteria bacterium]|nr:ArsA family ATPase [Deltaproteobacteria bacterium]